MAPKVWKLITSRVDKHYRVFNLRTDRALSPRTNQEHDFFILESSPWVNVIPLTDRNEVVLIKQYRHGIRDVTFEIPGGIVDNGETPLVAAKRELREETGYQAKEMIFLGKVDPNPAIQNNQCHTFLARDVFCAGDQNLDEKEDIEVVQRPVEEIPRLISGGAITHALVLAAFYRFYLEYLPGKSG